MNKWPETLQGAIQYFTDHDSCHRCMVALRWPDGKVTCHTCGSDKVTYLGKQRRFKCYGKHPKAQFSIKVGTIFEDSPLGLDKWLSAAWLICNCKNGISSYELARDLKVTQKSTWFMLHRIRLAMQTGTFKKLAGPVEADRTFLGGKAINMHPDKQTRLTMDKKRTGGFDGKTMVMAFLNAGAKCERRRCQTIVRFTFAPTSLRRREGVTVYNDPLRSYRNLPLDGYVHEFIDYTEACVRGQVHTNGLENFCSLFKRALKCTYVSVEPFHLQAYADEQCFRFNERKATDFQRFALVMMHVIGRRMTYNELTGKLIESEPG